MVTLSVVIPQSVVSRIPSRRHASLYLWGSLFFVFLVLAQLHSNATLPAPPARSLATDVHHGNDPTGAFAARLARLDVDLRKHFEGRGEVYNGTAYPSTLTAAQLSKYDALRGNSVRHPKQARRRELAELNSTAASFSSSIRKDRPYASDRGRILIVSNFFQTAPLLPDFLATVANLIHYLGPERLVFSVLEGPSSDGTPDILADIFLPLLLDMGVAREDIHLRLNWPRKNWEWRNRIDALAELRNEALEPLWASPPPEGWEAIVFLNDVYTTAAHVLELVHLHLQEGAGVTCAWDKYYVPGTFFKAPRQTFYDAWVARSHSSGDTFYKPHAQFSEESIFYSSPPEKERYKKNLPMQAMSCWNGIAILDARPFLSHGPGLPSPPPSHTSPSSSSSHPHASNANADLSPDAPHLVDLALLPPRSLPASHPIPPVRFRASSPGECAQSECFLICRDFWRWGLGKVQIVPSVKVGYVREMADWLASEKVEIGVRRGSRGEVLGEGREESVKWREQPPERVKCFPWPDLPGLVHDPWKSPDARWVDSLTG